MAKSNTSKLVEQILKEVPETRNSDKRLIIEFLQRKGANLNYHQQFIVGGTNMESIRRMRQKLQEKGKYPAAKSTSQIRRFKAMSVQQRIPTTEPQSVPGLIEEQPQTKLV